MIVTAVSGSDGKKYGAELDTGSSANNYENVVIVPKEKYTDLLSYCDAPPTKWDGTWDITRGDIEYFESMLPKILKKKSINKKYKEYEVRQWVRQYAGIFHKGEKYIYVKLFAPDLVEAEPRLSYEPLIICGYNINTFPLIYNLDKNVFVDATVMR